MLVKAMMVIVLEATDDANELLTARVGEDDCVASFFKV